MRVSIRKIREKVNNIKSSHKVFNNIGNKILRICYNYGLLTELPAYSIHQKK